MLIAFGVGFKKQMSINMHGIGESIAIMFPGKTTKPWEGFGIGRPMSFVEEDTKLLASQISGIKAISPEFGRRTPTRVGQNLLTPLISGIHPIYADMRNISPEENGRFIDDLDMQHRKRVAVIGNKVKEFLFGESDALGKIIYVGEVPFMVIGVMQKKTQSSSYNSRVQDRIFIPATTHSSIYGSIYLNNIIYQVHDPRLIRALNDMVRAGKILYIGISDTPAWIVSRMHTIAELRGWTQFVALQIKYSLIDRTVERELLPMARKLDMAVTPWAVIGGGILSGKYNRNKDEQGRAQMYKSIKDDNLKIADEVIKVADEVSCSPSQVAINWVRQQPGVIIPIIGAKTEDHLKDNIDCLKFSLNEERNRLNEVSKIDLGFPFPLDHFAWW